MRLFYERLLFLVNLMTIAARVGCQEMYVNMVKCSIYADLGFS